MCKFQNLFAAQILREINFRDPSSSKNVIFAILKALNFDFDYFLKCLRAKIYQKFTFRVFEIAKLAVFEIENS